MGSDPARLKGFQVTPGSPRNGVPARSRPVPVPEERYIQDGKVSEWTQTRWSGGAYQGVFRDPGQFSACLGMLPGSRNPEHLRTCPNLEMVTNQSGGAVSTGNYPELANVKSSFSAWDAIYLLGGSNTVYKFAPSGSGSVTASIIDVTRPGNGSATANCIAPMRGLSLIHI